MLLHCSILIENEHWLLGLSTLAQFAGVSLDQYHSLTSLLTVLVTPISAGSGTRDFDHFLKVLSQMKYTFYTPLGKPQSSTISHEAMIGIWKLVNVEAFK